MGCKGLLQHSEACLTVLQTCHINVQCTTLCAIWRACRHDKHLQYDAVQGPYCDSGYVDEDADFGKQVRHNSQLRSLCARRARPCKSACRSLLCWQIEQQQQELLFCITQTCTDTRLSQWRSATVGQCRLRVSSRCSCRLGGSLAGGRRSRSLRMMTRDQREKGAEVDL